jgi:GNAT superfamily N-acetyltransferase
VHSLDLLAAYDHEVRGSFSNRIPSTWSSTSDGPLTRCLTGGDGFVLSDSDLRAWSDEQIDLLVSRTTQHYRAQSLPFEWKTFGHDDPRLLTALTRHGFTAETQEALVLGDVDALTGPPPAEIPGITIREAGLADLSGIAAFESSIWGGSWNWFTTEMTGRMAAEDPVYVLLAEAGRQVVSAAWLVPMPGTSCAGLWGGSTLPEYRGRGIYRALVRIRANEAARRGYRLLQVDATDDSRPILEHLGLTTAGSTTPYRWQPTA